MSENNNIESGLNNNSNEEKSPELKKIEEEIQKAGEIFLEGNEKRKNEMDEQLSQAIIDEEQTPEKIKGLKEELVILYESKEGVNIENAGNFEKLYDALRDIKFINVLGKYEDAEETIKRIEDFRNGIDKTPNFIPREGGLYKKVLDLYSDDQIDKYLENKKEKEKK